MMLMSESRFRLNVAKELLEDALKAANAGAQTLAALGLVLVVENAVFSVISCLRPPSIIVDPVVELMSVIEDLGDKLAEEVSLLVELIEISQYIVYTYRNLLIYGDPTSGKLPSELLQMEDLSDLKSKARRAIEISEAIVAKLSATLEKQKEEEMHSTNTC